MNILLIFLGAPAILGFIYVIILYNQTVDLKHSIADMKAETQKIEVQSADLKDQYFAIFDPAKVESTAKARGLVKENKPAYLESNTWALASHF